MAKEDYFVADRPDAGQTAGEQVAETVQDTPDADAAAFAAAGGVAKAEYRNYATALAAFEDRADIEPLLARRQREYGDAFTDADFARTEVYDPETGEVNAPPRMGSVEGDAPKEA